MKTKNAGALKSFMRRPSARQYIRNLMMERLQREAQVKEAEQRAKEVNTILDQQQFGQTKPKRTRKKVAE